MRAGGRDHLRGFRLGARRSRIDVEEKLTRLEVTGGLVRDILHRRGGDGGDYYIGALGGVLRAGAKADSIAFRRRAMQRAAAGLIEENVESGDTGRAGAQQFAREDLADF